MMMMMSYVVTPHLQGSQIHPRTVVQLQHGQIVEYRPPTISIIIIIITTMIVAVDITDIEQLMA
jgi:hypothetical protein